MMTQIRSIWTYVELGHSDGEMAQMLQKHSDRWEAASWALVPHFHLEELFWKDKLFLNLSLKHEQLVHQGASSWPLSVIVKTSSI